MMNWGCTLTSRKWSKEKRPPCGSRSQRSGDLRRNRTFARQRAQAARANFHTLKLPIDEHALLLNVWRKHTLGAIMRVTDVVASRRTFPTNFALGHWYHLFAT